MITKIEESGQASYGLASFICDDENDIIELEEIAESVPAGSMALIINNGAVMVRRHVKNSDGKYWQEFTTDAKDSDSNNGSTDPILENAKATGGIGWTENGEQTILVDNEIVTTVDNQGLGVGQFETFFDIVDGAYTVIFNGTEYNLNSAFHEKAGFWYLGDASKNSPDFSRYPFMIASIDRGALKKAVFKSTELYTESAGEYEITVKMGSDTIHKIECKYLPEGGFGYTEQGNQTTITWDGDTDGKVDIVGHAYKISELTPTIEEVIGGVVVTKSQDDGFFSEEITADRITAISEHLYSIHGFGQSLVTVALEDGEIEGVTFERGMYYSKEGSGTYSKYISSLTYGTPDTVHKIDEKYLPGAQEKIEVIVTNIGNDGWEFDTETLPQNIDDYSNIKFIVYYLSPSAVGHNYVYAVIPCTTCTYERDRISSISGVPFVNGYTMIVPKIVYSADLRRYYGRVEEYGLQDNIE